MSLSDDNRSDKWWDAYKIAGNARWSSYCILEPDEDRVCSLCLNNNLEAHIKLEHGYDDIEIYICKRCVVYFKEKINDS